MYKGDLLWMFSADVHQLMLGPARLPIHRRAEVLSDRSALAVGQEREVFYVPLRPYINRFAQLDDLTYVYPVEAKRYAGVNAKLHNRPVLVI